jgi:hypothetical protein
MSRRPDCGSAPGGSGRYCPAVPFTWPRGFWSQPSLGLQGPELWLTGPPALGLQGPELWLASPPSLGLQGPEL